MHLLRLIGICTQIIGGRYDQTRTDTAINNLWYSDDRYLDESADALEAQAKEIEKLRTALELEYRATGACSCFFVDRIGCESVCATVEEYLG